MADVFISYASKDTDFVRLLVNALNAEGKTAWSDREIRGGEDFQLRIEQEIRDAELTIGVWSKNSMTSDWVRGEAYYAKKNGKLYVPVSIDQVASLPLGFSPLQLIDLSGWDGSSNHDDFRQIKRLFDSGDEAKGAYYSQAKPTVPQTSDRKNLKLRSWWLLALGVLFGVLITLVALWLFGVGLIDK